LRRNLWKSVVAAVALGLVSAYLHFADLLSLEPQPPREESIHALYVWQRAWTDDVRASVAVSVKHAAHLMVLAHEDGALPIDVDWQALAATKLPVTPVFRYSKILGAEIETDCPKAARRVSDTVSTVCEIARLKGLNVAGVQLDYDAPTNSLEGYGAFLVRIQEILPSTMPLSITALPTWLDASAFADIASTLDYYVLQVHSFQRPGSLGAPVVLCDTTRLADYVTAVEGIGVPYFIAFPTHGYEAAFDSTGAFIGLSAEGPAPAWPAGSILREIRADPSSIAGAIHALSVERPPHYRGAVWFRMPVATDTLNWTWPMLAAVMEGRTPSVRFTTELRFPDPGLAEIWLSSFGEDRSARVIEVRLALSLESVLAFDVLNDFELTSTGREEGVILTGESPVSEEPIMIGWFRMRDEAAANGIKVLGNEQSRPLVQRSETG